jgi:hypothetical protein
MAKDDDESSAIDPPAESTDGRAAVLRERTLPTVTGWARRYRDASQCSQRISSPVNGFQSYQQESTCNIL